MAATSIASIFTTQLVKPSICLLLANWLNYEFFYYLLNALVQGRSEPLHLPVLEDYLRNAAHLISELHVRPEGSEREAHKRVIPLRHMENKFRRMNETWIIM
ncbi:unnamed protein product [Litomosoides sigmodontis]|uniref:Uncharacterized protein n=1 Tax=Litomosoides sigmodontis TaxID=42156 RepID=A0A3P6TLD2_LITSI|nr:unnamed protein product [Litomosoides sigmodontis]